MVTAPGHAVPIERFSILGPDGVNVPGFGQGPQGPIDRGESNLVSSISQIRVELLCATEVPGVLQDLHDGLALAGRSNLRPALAADVS
jgi:hypothetical protein